VSITRQAGNARASANNATFSSLTDTLTGFPLNSGDALIATVSLQCHTAQTVSSIAQTNVTWNKIVSLLVSDNDAELWAAFNIPVSAGSTATVDLSGSSGTNSGGVMNICEYSGLSNSGQPDKTATNSGSSTTETDSGITATTSQASELWVASIYDALSQSSPTNGFTLLDGSSQTGGNAYLEKIVNSTGTANTGTTVIASNWVGVIATFQAAGTVSTPRIPRGGVGVGGVIILASPRPRLSIPKLTIRKV